MELRIWRKMLEQYQNFVFDLYGTLIDIHTDENKKSFWANMAGIYSCYGAPYTGSELHDKYLQLVQEDEIIRLTGCTYPEIRLEKVFVKLLRQKWNEADNSTNYNNHNYANISDIESIRTPQNYDAMYKMSDEELLTSPWADMISNVFRTISRSKLKTFNYTMPFLDWIKANGGKIYLLSNAQHLFTIPELDITGLTDYFDGIYISSIKGLKKPEKGFIEGLINEYNLKPEETLMTGNEMFSDMGSAMQAGVDGLFLNNDKMTPEKVQKKYKDVKEKFGGDNSHIYLNGLEIIKDILR